jgi:hypothetical protein
MRLDESRALPVNPARVWLPRAALALGAAGFLGEGRWSGASDVSEPAPVASTCRIKGNISGNGKKVYHLPGSRLYAQTEIETELGERWICTEEEAASAGWRASK